MTINLLHPSRIEGKALSLLLKTKGYQVNFDQTNPSATTGLTSKYLFVVDTRYLFQIDQSQKKWLCTSNHYIVLIGSLNHFFWFFEFYCKPGGFISNGEKVNDLYLGIDHLKKNETFLSGNVVNFLQKEKPAKQQHLLKQDLAYHLTKTELNIMLEIAKGKTTQRIAKEENRSCHTINNHRKNILKKLGLEGTFKLSKFCYRKAHAIKTLIAIANNQDFVHKRTKKDLKKPKL